MEDSILSRPVGPILSSSSLYSSSFARMCRGPVKFISEYSQSEEASKALRMAEGSYLYADPVISSHIPLYDLHVPKIHAFIGEGYINHNTTLARVFAKAVNCFGRGRRGIPSKTNRIGHRSVCGGDTSPTSTEELNRPAGSVPAKGWTEVDYPFPEAPAGERRSSGEPSVHGVEEWTETDYPLPPFGGNDYQGRAYQAAADGRVVPLKSWPVVAKVAKPTKRRPTR